MLTGTRSIDPPETISWDAENMDGSGSFCVGGDGPCLNPDEGEIMFETYVEDGSASGSFRIGSGDEAVTATFDATWCAPPEPIVCG